MKGPGCFSGSARFSQHMHWNLGTQSYLKMCVCRSMEQSHDLCSQVHSGSYSPRKAFFGTASCTMLTLSALPHNIARGFGQADRLYPIGDWLRAFHACVRFVYRCRPCMHSRTLPSIRIRPLVLSLKPCSSVFLAIIRADSGSSSDPAK